MIVEEFLNITLLALQFPININGDHLYICLGILGCLTNGDQLTVHLFFMIFKSMPVSLMFINVTI